MPKESALLKATDSEDAEKEFFVKGTDLSVP
jgi:hypothetical protein